MLISYILLFSTVYLLLIRNIYTGIVLLSMQSFLLAFKVIEMGLEQAEPHLYWVAFLTIGVKALLIPYILHITMFKNKINRDVERWMNRTNAFLFGIALLLTSSVVADRMDLPLSVSGQEMIEVALGMLLMGAYLMIIHKKAIMQGIGLITLENGIFLFSLAITNGIPFMIELGIFFDLLISVVIIGIFSHRIHHTFASLNTDKLQNLKG